MDKINLDITKYSCNELQEIFNIDNIVSGEQVANHFNTYKNTLFNDSNISLKDKDNITIFLNKVITKLIGSLDKGAQDSTENSLSYNSKFNTLLYESTNQHPIIADQNTIAGQNANTYDGRNVDSNKVPPGYINPINIRTIKKTVNVDTQFRDSYYSTKSSDFHVNLPESFKKVVKMRLSSLQIPLSIYAISQELGNYYFDVSSNNEQHIVDVRAPTKRDANYDITAIEANINTELIGRDISFQIDPYTGKSEFFSNNLFNIYFNYDSNVTDSSSSREYDLNTPLSFKLGWLLGFRAGSYTSNNLGQIDNLHRVVSDGICSITGPKYIYICVNDFTNAGNNNFIAAFSSSTLSPHIIARINYQSLVNKSGVYNYSDDDDDINNIYNRTREYFGPVDIQKLHFQILDEYGRVINLNNMDWSCTLTFDVLYD